MHQVCAAGCALTAQGSAADLCQHRPGLGNSHPERRVAHRGGDASGLSADLTPTRQLAACLRFEHAMNRILVPTTFLTSGAKQCTAAIEPLQACLLRPLALLLAPPGQAVRGALAPFQRPASSVPRPCPTAELRFKCSAQHPCRAGCAWPCRQSPLERDRL